MQVLMQYREHFVNASLHEYEIQLVRNVWLDVCEYSADYLTLSFIETMSVCDTGQFFCVIWYNFWWNKLAHYQVMGARLLMVCFCWESVTWPTCPKRTVIQYKFIIIILNYHFLIFLMYIIKHVYLSSLFCVPFSLKWSFQVTHCCKTLHIFYTNLQ